MNTENSDNSLISEQDIGKRQSLNEILPERERFRLAKTILLLSLLVYVGSAGLYVFGERFFISEPAKIVWQYSSQAIFGMINLVIGFYFGRK